MASEVGLTDAKIAGLKPPKSGQVEHSDKLIAGLRVRVGSSGAKTFILRKRVGGKLKNITLGRCTARFRLSDARRKARDLLVDIEAGKDPTLNLATPRKGGPTNAIRALIETYLATEVRGKKRSAREIERILNGYVVPAIGDRLADSISRADVTKLIDGVIHADSGRPKQAMGRAVFAQLSAFYSWAMPRLDRLPANPCRDAGKPSPVKSRERVLTDLEIWAFWKACSGMERPFGPGFKLLLLTGQRRAEVFEMDRGELQGDQWVIPAVRAKNGVASIVPLSKPALKVIEALGEIEGSTLLFPSRSDLKTPASGFSKATARLLKRMAELLEVENVDHFRPHDLRRTMATGMQRLGAAQPVVEAVLNHVSGSRSGVAGIYQRYDYVAEKREALDLWAAEVVRITAKKPSPRQPGQVVTMRRKGRANG